MASSPFFRLWLCKEEEELRQSQVDRPTGENDSLLEIHVPRGVSRETLLILLRISYGSQPRLRVWEQMQDELHLLRSIIEDRASTAAIATRLSLAELFQTPDIIKWALACFTPAVPSGWKASSGNLDGYLRWLVDNPLFSDVTFTIHGRTIHAHKPILVRPSCFVLKDVSCSPLWVCFLCRPRGAAISRRCSPQA